jgi:hypothetical protein
VKMEINKRSAAGGMTLMVKLIMSF